MKLINLKIFKRVKTEFSKNLGRVVAQPFLYLTQPLWQKIKNHF